VSFTYRPDRSVGWNRKARCIADPMAFARIYLSHHLRSEETGGEMTFSDVHHAWCEIARGWMLPLGGPMSSRDAFVAPRSMGKSTWWFLILPMWAAAYGYVKFVAAFADSATQAEAHLQTFKSELDNNEKLRDDFPELVAPARRPRGTQVADNRAMLFTASGFVFAARGIDSSSLGMKVGERRPDLLIFDDVEPTEASYSPELAKKRLGTITDAIFPLNVNARVVIVGTVTMPGSIIHQLVRSVRETGDPEQWIVDEKVKCHYYPPIVTDETTGEERSVWPGRWTMDFLNSIRHTASFAKNYANDPRGINGAYWSSEDYTYGDDDGASAHRWLISIDPAVTTKKSSDFTGVSVVSCRRDGTKAVVHYAVELKVKGEELREVCLQLLDTFPEIGLILIESNQGGEVWGTVLHHMPVKVRAIHQNIKKEVRASQAHTHYQRGRVLHARRLDRLEEQQIGFPKAAHDDMVDSVGTALIYFLGPRRAAPKAGASTASYV
jgi:predicted phage terminase large subunit-like protein